MRDRTFPTARGTQQAAVSLDIVLCAPLGRSLTILLVRAAAGGREQWTLPWAWFEPGTSPDDGARHTASHALGAKPSWITQVGATGNRYRHPGDAALSIGYVAVTPSRDRAPSPHAQWFPLGALPPLAPRHATLIATAQLALRERLDTAPIAFRLLPATFTLTELQEVYELLLGRRVHKASFRRSLQAAWLVEPTDEWRSEGRGRPAQLFRYAPRKRRGGRRGVRFELLGG
jgi:8-oxo-dGTP diphosphatase